MEHVCVSFLLSSILIAIVVGLLGVFINPTRGRESRVVPVRSVTKPCAAIWVSWKRRRGEFVCVSWDFYGMFYRRNRDFGEDSFAERGVSNGNFDDLRNV